MIEWLQSVKGWKTCLIVGIVVFGANIGIGIIPMKPGEALCEQETYEIVKDERTGKEVYEPRTEMRSIVPEEPPEDFVPLPHAKGPRILSRHTNQTWPEVSVKHPLAWYFYLRIDQLIWLVSLTAIVWGIYSLSHFLYQRYETRRKIEEARDRDAMRRDV